jgi:hypothetical protein
MDSLIIIIRYKFSLLIEVNELTEKRSKDSGETELHRRTVEVMKARDDPRDLQAERGGLKVKDSDFKTE